MQASSFGSSLDEELGSSARQLDIFQVNKYPQNMTVFSNKTT